MRRSCNTIRRLGLDGNTRLRRTHVIPSTLRVVVAMCAVCGATEPDLVVVSLVGTLMYVGGAMVATVGGAELQSRDAPEG
jgi:hypothetical protein